MTGRADASAHSSPSVLPFAVMTLGMFMALLDIQIVASSLRDIGGGLSAGQEEISWVQTAYLIAEIIVIPLSGWLTRVFSTRWVVSGSALGFTLASMLCGLAWNIQSMIFFRALQGLLGASMIPAVFTSTFHYFPGKRQPLAAAVIATMSAIAPALGPVIGGWITDSLSWRWLFYINLVPGALVAIGAALLVNQDTPEPQALRDADWWGIGLLAVFLGMLEYVLEEGSRWNWFEDADIRAASWTSAAAGILFVWRSLSYAHPVVDLRALRNRNFMLGCLASFVTGLGMFSTIYLIPLFLAYVRGFSAFQIGEVVWATGFGVLLGVPLYVALARRVDPRLLMMIGLSAFALSMFQFSFVTSDWGADQYFWPQILRGLPQVFAVAPAVTLGLGSLSAARLKFASGLFNMMRNLGGAVGIAICGSLLNDRTNLHFLRLAEATSSNLSGVSAAVQGFAGIFSSALGDPSGSQRAALVQLRQQLFEQASTLAFADAFAVVMVACASAALLPPLMRAVRPASPSTESGH